ncbi:hypothetical protein F7725_001063, partial [Dissostichus mawsoni]
MQHVTVRCLLFFLLLLHPVTSVDLEEVDKVSVEVVVDSSPCSATCGLGVKTQTLCLLKDGKKAMKMVSWRYARGIISSDDTLFARWNAPLLERVILDPVMEEDAGTYRCVVQDASFRRVKRVYWGIRVLPSSVLNLDYESSLAQWDSGNQKQNQTESDQRTPLIYTV